MHYLIRKQILLLAICADKRDMSWAKKKSDKKLDFLHLCWLIRIILDFQILYQLQSNEEEG